MNEKFKKDLKRRLSSRKFQITIVGFITATVLIVYGFLPPTQYVDLLKWIFAVYAAGNVGEHVSKSPTIQAAFTNQKSK